MIIRIKACAKSLEHVVTNWINELIQMYAAVVEKTITL